MRYIVSCLFRLGSGKGCSREGLRRLAGNVRWGFRMRILGGGHLSKYTTEETM